MVGVHNAYIFTEFEGYFTFPGIDIHVQEALLPGLSQPDI